VALSTNSQIAWTEWRLGPPKGMGSKLLLL
jgi:hypothetical protein